MTREERIKFGSLAEEAFCLELDKLGIKYSKTKDFDSWSPYNDLLWGDVIVYLEKPIYLDVKIKSISLKSVQSFKGDFFAITLPGFKDWYLIPSCSMKAFVEKVRKNKNLIKLDSGDLGFQFNKSILDRMYTSRSINEMFCPSC